MTTNHETKRIERSTAYASRAVRFLSLAALASGALAQEPAPATTVIEVPLQQVTRLHNSQPNVLEGIGLVVGLNGTGAGDVASRLAVSNFVRTHGNNVNPSELVGGSAALVQLRAVMPPFSQEGMTFDVTAASLGDATSLGGGMLVQSELRGIDGVGFALASGPLVVGGFAAGG